ncbi:MAG: response regulator transcription factor [Leptolinea sp.]|nr:response regulator transcription factor [Leptolinea sp.]
MITSAHRTGIPVAHGKDLDNVETENPHKRILIIDDEIETINLVKYILMDAGMDVISATTGDEAIKKTAQTIPDAILLDLMIPDMDGWKVYDEIRKTTNAPVIIISGLSGKEYVVRGLRSGAEDYISKPFYPSELVARINRVTQHPGRMHLSQIFRFPAFGLMIDSNTREVTYEDKVIVLPVREFKVLAALARRPGHWVDLGTIAFEVWNDTQTRVQNRIKYLVFLLRSQLEKDPRNPRLILSREGLGYKLAVSPGFEHLKEGGDARLNLTG